MKVGKVLIGILRWIDVAYTYGLWIYSTTTLSLNSFSRYRYNWLFSCSFMIQLLPTDVCLPTLPAKLTGYPYTHVYIVLCGVCLRFRPFWLGHCTLSNGAEEACIHTRARARAHSSSPILQILKSCAPLLHDWLMYLYLPPPSSLLLPPSSFLPPPSSLTLQNCCELLPGDHTVWVLHCLLCLCGKYPPSSKQWVWCALYTLFCPHTFPACMCMYTCTNCAHSVHMPVPPYCLLHCPCT